MKLRDVLAIATLELALAGPAAHGGYPVRAAFAGTPASYTVLSPEEQNVLRGEDLFHQARELMRAGDIAQATERLNRIVGMHFPADPPAQELLAGAHASLAEIFLSQRQFREAQGAALAGLQLTGSDARPAYLRADIYELLGRVMSSQNRHDQARQYHSLAQDCRRRAPRP